MPSFEVKTPQRNYPAVVERGILGRVADYLPAKAVKVFVAAIFMRGIPVLQVPTTLLAQVDAAIGGKTGVNLVAGKNLIGSFLQPMAVLIDPAALDTLPRREYGAGLFEVIKYGVISSPALFRLLSERQNEVAARVPDVVDVIIAESVRIK